MSFMRHTFSAAVALAVTGSAALAEIVFSEDFDVDHTANWTVNRGPTPDGQIAEFFFDYSTVGIPPAPNSVGGTTRGLRLRANLPPAAPTFSGLSVSPIGFSVEGSYELRFDAWLNYNGPLNGGGTGSTQCTGWGIMTSGTTPQWAGGVQDSLWFAMTGDGGSSVDYRAYSPAAGTGYTPTSGVFAAGTSTSPDSRNNTHSYYATLGGLAAPAAQLAAFPTQTGNTLAGAPGFKWWRVIIRKEANIVTWKLVDPDTASEFLLATVDVNTINPPLTHGNILFNQFDINDTQINPTFEPDAPELLFGLIDNIEVDKFAGPPIITDQPDHVLITVGEDAIFTVAATPALNGTLHYQWIKNDLENVGTDSPTLTLTNVPFSENGSTYKVVITEEGNPDSATSSTAVLIVQPIPCNDPFADADGDGDVDMDDFGAFQLCFTGHQGIGFDAGFCGCFDRNFDNDVDAGGDGVGDQSDFQAFLNCVSGANIPADPSCDDYPTGQVVINEIVYDIVNALGTDVQDTREFVELYNAGPTPVDISGWELRASDTVGPGPGPFGDDNPDYKVSGAPGSGTVILGPGEFYVMGSASVENVNQVIGSTDLFENGPDAIQLLDGNGNVIDTLIYERNAGAMAIGEGEGNFWGNHVSSPNSLQSLARWFDGYDTNNNGRDFGVLPQTPGTSNHAGLPIITAYIPPNVDGGVVGDPVPGLVGSFKNARIIDPQQAPEASPGVAGINPNVIPPSPQGGYAIVAWDDAGGGNMVQSEGLMTTDGSFDLWVYFDTSDITVAGAESTMFGIMGTVDPLYNFPDPDGNFFGDVRTLNSATGIAWVFNKNNAGNNKKLFLVDAGDGGDSSPGPNTPNEWVIIQTIDMSSVPSGWYRLSLSYTGATGQVTARFDTQVFNFTTTPNLVGAFYVGYRESLAGQPLTLRPPTFDLVE